LFSSAPPEKHDCFLSVRHVIRTDDATSVLFFAKGSGCELVGVQDETYPA